MLRNFDHTMSFGDTEPRHTHRSASPTAALSWPIVSALLGMWDDLSEGLAAHRHYERLRSRGVPHATALRESLGFGATPSDRL
jgi:hypothetical protein